MNWFWCWWRNDGNVGIWLCCGFYRNRNVTCGCVRRWTISNFIDVFDDNAIDICFWADWNQRYCAWMDKLYDARCFLFSVSFFFSLSFKYKQLWQTQKCTPIITAYGPQSIQPIIQPINWLNNQPTNRHQLFWQLDSHATTRLYNQIPSEIKRDLFET